MPGFRRKATLFAGLFAGLFLLMVFGVSFFLKTETAQILIQQKINTRIPGKVSWQQLKLSPFTGVIDFENFQLRGSDKKQIIGLKRFQVNLAVLRLFAGEVFISSILLESPVLDIQIENDGSVNIVSAFLAQKDIPVKETDDSRSFPLNVIVDRLFLTNGTLLFNQPAHKISAQINALEVQVRAFNLAQKVMDINVSLKDSFFRQSEKVFNLDEINASAALNNETISPLSFSLISDAVNIGIKGSAHHVFDDPEVAVTLDSVVDIPNAARMFQMEQSLDGSVTIALSAMGRLEDPTVDVSVKYSGKSISGQKIDTAVLHLSLKDRFVKILPSLTESLFGKLSLDGTIDLSTAFPNGFLDQTQNLDDISYTLFVEQKGADISKFLPEDNDIRGDFTSHLTLEGSGIDPEKLKANLTLDIDAIRLKQETLNQSIDVRIKTKAGMANKKIFLESMTVNTPGLVMKVSGEFAPYTREIKGVIDLNADDISLAAGLGNIKGRGKVKLLSDISGSLDSPEISLDVSLEKLGLDRLTIGNISTSMDFSNGTIFIKAFELANKRSLFSAKGKVQIMEKGFSFIDDPKFQLSLDAPKIFLDDFVKQTKGELSLSATAKGTITDPSVDITLVGNGMAMAGKILGDVKGKANFTRGVLNIDSFKVKNRQSSLDIHGSLNILKPDTTTLLPLPDMDITIQANTLYLEDFFNNMTGRFSANGYIKGTPEDFESNLDVNGSRIDLGIQKIKAGVLDLNLSGSGTLKDPFITGKLTAYDLSVNEEKMNNIDFDFNVKEKVAQIKGDFGFRVDGKYHLEDRSFEVDLDLKAANLIPYFKLAGLNDLSGNISGTVNAKGSIDQPEALSATADITNVIVRFKHNKFINIPGSSLSFEKGFLDVGRTDIHLLEKGLITINGRGGLKTDLAFIINGDIPLEVINPVAKDFDDVTGNIKIAASIKGSVENPMIKADVILEQLGVSLPAIEQKLQNVNGHIQVSAKEILIKRFDGQLGDEKFDLKGNVLLSNFLPEKFDIDFNAHQLSLDFPDLMDISISSSLNLSGTNKKSALTGEIVLLEGRYYKDFKLNLATAAQRQRQHPPVKEKKEIPFLESVFLNIDIKHQEPFWIDNNIAFISIIPELNIHGTAANPLIDGRARVESGIITFQRNEFEVKKGIIDFINPYKIEPTFDIEGEMEVRTWTVYLTVSGTPDNLDFNLHSKPDEQDVDILSLLAFGKTTSELRKGDGGSGSLAGEMFASFVAEALQKEMKAASGMDYLEIEMDDTDDLGDLGELGVNVTVGKELSRYVTVKYGVDVRNGETVQRVITDYKILENLLMSGFQDTGGDFGGELKYRLEFR